MAGEDEADQAPSARLTTAEPATAQQRLAEPGSGQPTDVGDETTNKGETPAVGEGEKAAGDTQRTIHGGGAPAGRDQTAAEAIDEQPPPGFGERGRMRRRARFLRKARELAYRDLGGLVFDLHRFGQRNDPLVLAKLSTLGQIDSELRAIERALHELKPVTVLREVGIGACPRCAALHGSEDRFCPGCGMAFDAGAERPLSTTPMAPAPSSQPAPATASGAPPAPEPAPAAAEPLTALARPDRPPQATPPIEPTAAPIAAPVAARTGAPSGESRGAESPSAESPSAESRSTADRRGGPGNPDEEPTQILHPPGESA